MLAWPAFSLLKSQYPDSCITALVPSYTELMAKLCPWIDEVIIDEHHSSLFTDISALTRKLRQHDFDASISLFTETRTAAATFLARIPLRIAPATKLAQLFSNRCLRQRRSASAKAEHEYNTDLARYFIELQGEKPESLKQPPYLQFDDTTIHNLRTRYTKQHDIQSGTKLVIVHPGTGGSAINFSVEQYAALVTFIAEQVNAHFIITAGPGEEKTAEALSALLPEVEHNIYVSTQGIVSFSKFIAICDLFISGSTGTLHIAGALDVPTAAFYPARKSATPLRWQTLNQKGRRLAFSPEKYTGDTDMQTIDPRSCAQQIINFMQQLAA